MNIITPVLFLLLIGYGIWVYKRLPKKNPPPPGRRSCVVEAAKEYRFQLEQIRDHESWRAVHLTGLAQQRASWLEAKVDYVLRRVGNKLEDANNRNLLEDTYLMIMRARHQALQGSEDMVEEWGGRLRTYVSPIDGTVQTYSVSIPNAYDPAIKWPLIVSMHGHGWYGKYHSARWGTD